jgi:hypothetical protein
MLCDVQTSVRGQRTSVTSPPVRQAILAALLFTSSIFGQTNSVISGTVTTRGGQPVAGVLVYGSMSTTCCPSKREQTTTDSEGHFRLEQSGRVVHFSQSGLQPKAIVFGEQLSEIRVAMDSDTNSLVVPKCEEPAPGYKRIGWGLYGLQFNVAVRGVKILGGKPDVDYVRYAIKPKRSKAYLELWFGGYAVASDADDDRFIDSTEFAERNVVFPDGSIIGKDSSGRLRSGGSWRHTAVMVEGGAIYRDATQEDAQRVRPDHRLDM